MLRSCLTVASLALFGLFLTVDGLAQKDNYKKNSKTSENERERYEKDLKEHPDSAEPHWRYANIVAGFGTNESKDAWKYFQQALKIDSTRAAIWSDYGDYLLKEYNDAKYALYLYDRALKLEPENKKLKDKTDELRLNVEKANETARLRDIGNSERRKFDHGIRYSVISNFDSLQAITRNAESRYSYESLLKRFLEDDPLNEWETYMLCLGYATTGDYSPYSSVSNDILAFNKKGEYDQALAKGEELLKKNPVSPSLYRELMYAHRRKGANDIAERYMRRAQRLYEAMIFTGDGTCEKPYVTLTTTEEYALIHYLMLYSTGSQALMTCNGDQTDRLSIEDDEGKKGELYFNVSLLFGRMSKVYKK